MQQLITVVRRAADGDSDSFAYLVMRFQDMAVGYAYSVLEDFQLAEDASQEAFIEAFRDLSQLREPKAFPSWLRRLVFKQCDRIWRGKHQEAVPLEAAQPLASRLPEPIEVAEQSEVRGRVRSAIQSLPENERRVTMLFYISDYSQREITEFLDIPVTTVKKRLYAARKSLRKEMLHMVTEHMRGSRPSQDQQFVTRVEFFIAVKNGDLLQVEALLGKNSELAHARTDGRLTSKGHFWPIGTTALNWAARMGDTQLATLLISHGSDVNGIVPSGDRDQAPLHEATNTKQVDMVRLLIERGADVNAATLLGQTPLHNAVLRNDPEIARLLIENKADVNVITKQGYAPVDWAAVRGHSRLIDLLVEHGAARPEPPASAATIKPSHKGRSRKAPTGQNVLGRLIDGSGQPIDDGPALNKAQAQPIYRSMANPVSSLLETGIKVIDLIAPLRRGGHHGLFTPLSGVGLMFVAGQLVQSISTLHGGYVVYMGLEEVGYAAKDRQNEFRMEMGVDDETLNSRTVFVYGKAGDPDSKWRQVAETGLTIAEDFRGQGHDVLLVVEGKLTLSDELVCYLKTNAGSTPDAAITTLYVANHTVGLEPDHIAVLDSGITFNRERALQGLFPAIDPVRSASRMLRDGLLGSAHTEVATEAQRLIRRYDDGLHWAVEHQGLDGLSYLDDPQADRLIAIRSRRLQRFLTQPLPGADHFSGIPGVYVSLEDTIKGCRAIVDGKYDSLPEQAFYMVGTIESAVEKADRL